MTIPCTIPTPATGNPAPRSAKAHSGVDPSSAASSLRLAGLADRAGTLPGTGGSEAVIISCRPSLWFILLHRAGTLLGLLLIAVAVDRLARLSTLPVQTQTINLAAAFAILGLLVWNTIDWWCRSYVLTTARIVRTSGVLARVHREIILTNVQSVTVVCSLRERLVGAGSVGVSSAAAQGIELAWYMVAQPHLALDQIRLAVDRARRAGPGGLTSQDVDNEPGISRAAGSGGEASREP